VAHTHTSPLSLRAAESLRIRQPAATLNVHVVESLPDTEIGPVNALRLFQHVDGTQPAPLSGAT
jgi:hypothetical protein